jgi:hypothetical protein
MPLKEKKKTPDTTTANQPFGRSWYVELGDDATGYGGRRGCWESGACRPRTGTPEEARSVWSLRVSAGSRRCETRRHRLDGAPELRLLAD